MPPDWLASSASITCPDLGGDIVLHVPTREESIVKYRVLLLFLAGLLITACGDDKPAPQAAKPAASESPATTEETVAADEEEIVYDLIDVSKLDNQWWQQYSGGGG